MTHDPSVFAYQVLHALFMEASLSDTFNTSQGKTYHANDTEAYLTRGVSRCSWNPGNCRKAIQQLAREKQLC